MYVSCEALNQIVTDWTDRGRYDGLDLHKRTGVVELLDQIDLLELSSSTMRYMTVPPVQDSIVGLSIACHAEKVVEVDLSRPIAHGHPPVRDHRGLPQ